MTTWASFNRFRKTKACLALYSVVTFREAVFKYAFFVSFPCALVAAALKYWDNDFSFGGSEDGVISTIIASTAYSSFTFLLSMLTVFRTSQSYARYWEAADGTYQIGSDLFDVASSVCSFCKMSDTSVECQAAYQQTLVRLFSVLHALIMTELAGDKELLDEDRGRKFHLIEYDGLDADTRTHLAESPCKVDLVFQWIQSMLVEACKNKIVAVPPPILTRAFQELNVAMGQFHRCLKIAESPFPFPYTAASEMILLVNWFITPLIAGTWTHRVSSAFVLAFLQVFVVTSLHSIAAELENPFEGEEHDLDTIGMQAVFNSRLMQLLIHTTTKTPTLQEAPVLDSSLLQTWKTDHSLLALNEKAIVTPLATKSMAPEPRRRLSAFHLHQVQARVIEHKALHSSLTLPSHQFTTDQLAESPATRSWSPGTQAFAEKQPPPGSLAASRRPSGGARARVPSEGGSHPPIAEEDLAAVATADRHEHSALAGVSSSPPRLRGLLEL